MPNKTTPGITNVVDTVNFVGMIPRRRVIFEVCFREIILLDS